MDYAKLFEKLPKEPIKWNVHDVEIWLVFIGLGNLYPRFSPANDAEELAIDGSCISSLSEEDFKLELGVSSGIILRKLISCSRANAGTQNGLREYSEYVRSLLSTSQAMAEELPAVQAAPDEPVPANEYLDVELILQPCEGQTSFFSIKKEGAKIGRHSTNEILILDEGVSRFHAEISFVDGRFYLMDTRSTAGTFMKVLARRKVYDGMLLEMGSNQFLVKFTPTGLTLEVIDGPGLRRVFEIARNTRASIGRKPSNAINFSSDQHLSNVHSTIFWLDSVCYVEDMGTTNGTWERLSKEGEESDKFELLEGTVFKIGSNQSYVCKIKETLVTENVANNPCIICCEGPKDCVYMPCRHNVACIKCSKGLRECPMCRLKIEDFLRIYRD